MRDEFPIFDHHPDLIYLDSAASAHKPRSVIEALTRFYSEDYATVHRAIYRSSLKASEQYHETRLTAARFVHAAAPEEIIFTRGTTDGINLVAQSFGKTLKPGDEILISEAEHHSNLVPWQMLRDSHGIELRIAPITDAGELDMAGYEALLQDRKVGLVSITHMSNVLGTYTPAERIIQLAHQYGAKAMLDGSQSVVHRRIDVQALDGDFFAITGHKIYGPTGIGALYAKRDLLDAMPPWLGGGDMIRSVSFEASTWNDAPYKFEAGTPAILEGIGLKAAIDYVQAIGLDAIAAHERTLTEHALAKLAAIDGVKVLGHAQDRGGVISFTLDGAHAHDVATLLDRQGIAVRAGHHCAEPLMRRLGVDSTSRASFGVYTTMEEVDALATALVRIREFFQ